MWKNTRISNKGLTFSQWTRKNYAVFASLGKVVKIAQLSVDLCISSSLKNRDGFIQLFSDNKIAEDDLEEDGDERSLLQVLLQKGIQITTTTNITDTYQRQVKILTHYSQPIICNTTGNGFFYYHTT